MSDVLFCYYCHETELITLEFGFEEVVIFSMGSEQSFRVKLGGRRPSDDGATERLPWAFGARGRAAHLPGHLHLAPRPLSPSASQPKYRYPL